MSDDIAQRMQDARIPPHARRTTLDREGQALLRAVITDKAYVSKGALRSILITTNPANPVPPAAFLRVFGRFAAELLLAGQQVLYVRAAGLSREVAKLEYSGTVEAISPVLQRIGKGFLIVPDMYSNEYDTPSAVWAVCDVLLEHVSRGGGLVLGHQHDPDYVTGRNALTAEFDAVVDGAFTSYAVEARHV